MFEWAYGPYSRLLWGMESLLHIPGDCMAPVDVVRALTLLLFGAAAARILASGVADLRLRRRFPVYGPDEFAGLYDLYRQAAARVGLKRLPPLHRHADEGPLAFTTGCFFPAVFLAPAVVRTLGPDELRAVLVHELVHVRQRDNLRTWLGSLLPTGLLVVLVQAAALYVLYFRRDAPIGFPDALLIASSVIALLWAFRSVVWPRVVFRRELSCDDRVVEAVRDPLVVAASLLQVWRLQSALAPRPGMRWAHAYPLLRGRVSVEQRVRRLIDYRPGPRRAWLVVARRAVGAAAVLWTTAFLWSYHTSDVSAELRAELRQSAPPLVPPRR